jgi:hypothetical protein
MKTMLENGTSRKIKDKSRYHNYKIATGLF